MALVKCKECGNEVSTKAAACPKCGAKMPKRTSLGTWIVGGFFAFIVGSCAIGMNKADEERAVRDAKVAAQEFAKPPAQREAEAQAKAKKEREFQIVLTGAQRLKDAMKKPETFELKHASMIDGKVICYEYTARNSFNDQTREVYVVTDTVSSGDAKAWNKHCAGKGGTDFTYARAVLR